MKYYQTQGDFIDKVNELILQGKEQGFSTKNISDKWHTFGDLYHHRMILTYVILKTYPTLSWKSKQHHDGTMFDDSFICGINTPKGQYSYHYNLEHWDLFDIRELDKAPVYDGHKPEDISRLLSLLDKVDLNTPQHYKINGQDSMKLILDIVKENSTSVEETIYLFNTLNYTIEQLEAMQQKFYKKGLQAAMDLAVAVPMMVLRDYYDFGREQLEDFATHYSDLFDSVDKGYLNVADMIKTLEEELNIETRIKE